MKRPKSPSKKIVKLEEFRTKIEARLHCIDCKTSQIYVFRATQIIENLHCKNCANQSLRLNE